MTEHTPIDAAHAAMTAAPDDDTPRLRFYERLAASELFVLLEGDAEGDKITPQLFDAEGTPPCRDASRRVCWRPTILALA